jgi:ATP-dependent exoDNAse (exonuclease V) alpha subunit
MSEGRIVMRKPVNVKTEPVKTEPMKSIELNEQFRKALDLMESGRKNVFVTGKAGTGKSTLLEYFRSVTRKKVAVLAPTGVAALNVDGQTIHSFFRFRTDITPEKVKKYKGPGRELYMAVETIIIDEISMVRADLLDCVDRFMRLNGKFAGQPFGGAQMIFIGDLYQLPPVVTGKEKEAFRVHYGSQYFFDSKAFHGIEMEFIELEKVYRQSDARFIGLLNSIRNNSAGVKELAQINSRVDPWFKPAASEFYISLTTTNAMAAEINDAELSKLRFKLCRYAGEIEGDFGTNHLPTEIDLKLKAGAQIMMVNNDSRGRWVNGTVGRIERIVKNEDEESDVIIVELRDKRKVEVVPYTWKIHRMYYDKEKGALGSEAVGSFTQYPLRLAWAVTIHKSQGKTFDRVIIDIGKGTFSHGQVYVALSRCTSLGGMVLRKPLEKKHIFMDWKVVRFLTKYQYGLSEKKLSLDEKVRMIEAAIKGRSRLDIVYLKSNDEKSRRTIEPKRVGKMEYMGRPYTGIEAYCHKRKEDRIFRVDKILEMKEAGN